MDRIFDDFNGDQDTFCAMRDKRFRDASAFADQALRNLTELEADLAAVNKNMGSTPCNHDAYVCGRTAERKLRRVAMKASKMRRVMRVMLRLT